MAPLAMALAKLAKVSGDVGDGVVGAGVGRADDTVRDDVGDVSPGRSEAKLRVVIG